MIALFNSQAYATRAANLIHNYLLENRKGYLAVKWNDTNKSDNAEKWAVKIPDEVPVNLIIGEAEFVEKLPDNWHPVNL